MPGIGNVPSVKLGVAAVSRDCFPVRLARRRLEAVVEECGRLGLGLGLELEVAGTVIESEADAVAAARELGSRGVDALVIYLGNFGPEGPTTVFAREMGLPFMLAGAAEESGDSLVDGRGDALCGMLNASYNSALRSLRPYIPERPIGLPGEVAEEIRRFADVARVVVGVRRLKVLAFGPRPEDFYACNAPIEPLYELGVEVTENSELDLLLLFKSAGDRKSEIEAVASDMARELGDGNAHPEKLEALAQFELALEAFMAEKLGSRSFGVFANKCWPSFEPAFGFVPCFVNSRLASRGVPVACEVDIYGAVSEYMAMAASGVPPTLLDVNNSVPPDMDAGGEVPREDLFMGFHCGNTPSCHLAPGAEMRYQLIMHRLMEPGREPDITCGTLEGRIRPGPVTLFRLQGWAGRGLASYLAEGTVLDADPRTFGGTGIFAVSGFARFYRHVLLEGRFPHHAAIAFERSGRVLWDALGLLGVRDVRAPLPAGVRYPTENPFAG